MTDPAKRRTLNLLPASAVSSTSRVDHPDWNYRRWLGAVQRRRFRIALDLLAPARAGRMLEIGFGSGVFMPELAQRCDELYGIDPHPGTARVAENLSRHRVVANLSQGSAESLPYRTGFFDWVVTVSALEFVTDIDAGCREVRRVLAPGGSLVVVTPGASPVWDLALRIATRETPAIFGDRRQKLLPALRRHFQVDREIGLPRFGGQIVRLYTGLRLQAR